MSRSPKEIIKDFYSKPILEDRTVLKSFFDQNVEVTWNSSNGLTVLDFGSIFELFEGIRKSYTDLRVEISHILSDENFVTVRHKYYVKTFENPDEEIGIAHFIAIWELSDDKIIRGHIISQSASKKDEKPFSYEPIRV